MTIDYLTTPHLKTTRPQTTPDFDQVVLDMVTSGEFTLERLAVIGVLRPSGCDRFETMMSEPPIKGEVVVPVVDAPDQDVIEAIQKTLDNVKADDDA